MLTKNRIIALAVAVSALLPALDAQAGSLGRPCTTTPPSEWMTIQALQAKVEAQGYKVQKAKLKNACGEIYTIDKAGKQVELFLDPATGAVVGQM